MLNILINQGGFNFVSRVFDSSLIKLIILTASHFINMKGQIHLNFSTPNISNLSLERPHFSMLHQDLRSHMDELHTLTVLTEELQQQNTNFMMSADMEQSLTSAILKIGTLMKNCVRNCHKLSQLQSTLQELSEQQRHRQKEIENYELQLRALIIGSFGPYKNVLSYAEGKNLKAVVQEYLEEYIKEAIKNNAGIHHLDDLMRFLREYQSDAVCQRFRMLLKQMQEGMIKSIKKHKEGKMESNEDGIRNRYAERKMQLEKQKMRLKIDQQIATAQLQDVVTKGLGIPIESLIGKLCKKEISAQRKQEKTDGKGWGLFQYSSLLSTNAEKMHQSLSEAISQQISINLKKKFTRIPSQDNIEQQQAQSESQTLIHELCTEMRKMLGILRQQYTQEQNYKLKVPSEWSDNDQKWKKCNISSFATQHQKLEQILLTEFTKGLTLSCQRFHRLHKLAVCLECRQSNIAAIKEALFLQAKNQGPARQILANSYIQIPILSDNGKKNFKMIATQIPDFKVIRTMHIGDRSMGSIAHSRNNNNVNKANQINSLRSSSVTSRGRQRLNIMKGKTDKKELKQCKERIMTFSKQSKLIFKKESPHFHEEVEIKRIKAMKIVKQDQLQVFFAKGFMMLEFLEGRKARECVRCFKAMYCNEATVEDISYIGLRQQDTDLHSSNNSHWTALNYMKDEAPHATQKNLQKLNNSTKHNIANKENLNVKSNNRTLKQQEKFEVN